MNVSNVPLERCRSATVIFVDPTGHVDAMVDPALECRDGEAWVVGHAGMRVVLVVEVEDVLAIVSFWSGESVLRID